MDEKKLKRWTTDESKMLDVITNQFGAGGVVQINRVPLDMWPPERTIGASCFQLTQNGWRTSGFTSEQRKQKPGEMFHAQTGGDMGSIAKQRRPRKQPTQTTTTTWFWGLYTKTIEK